MGEFRMPALGADMQQGTLVEWLVKPGDVVHRGQFIASIDTDKSVIDVETFEDGVVGALLAEVGDVLPVGAPLARIVAGSPAAAGAPSAPPAPAAPAAAPLAPAGEHPRPAVSPPVRALAHRAGVDLTAVDGTGPGGAVTHEDVERAAQPVPAEPVPAEPRRRGPSSPRARRLAAVRGIDLATLTGSGPGGAVTERDLAATSPPAVAPPPAPTDGARRAAGLRRAIGTLMARSKKTIPHYYLSTAIDLAAASAWLAETNAARPLATRLVPATLLLKATALAARETPEMNGYFTDGAFHPSGAVHLGVVVALRKGGVVAPALLDADRLDLDELMAHLHDLVTRARGGRLQRAEMADATLTVTNLGDLGVDSVLGVIYPPQVALVGFGRISEQPWAHDGMVGVRPALTATLSADHRVSDGMRGARFLSRIDELLQEPEKL